MKNWIAVPPAWVDVRQTSRLADASSERLDAGERQPLPLALEFHADLLPMDDEEGVMAARQRGLEVTGTLGVLSRAAQRHLLNLAEAFDRLKHTNSRFRQEMMDRFLDEQGGMS